MLEKTTIYLDNAATTRCAPEVLAAMMTYFTDNYGNPSSTHIFGRRARSAVIKAEQDILEALDASNYRVIFTSGATEANNLAIRTAVEYASSQTRTIVLSSRIEHKSVLEPLRIVAPVSGATIKWLPISSQGLVELDSLENELASNRIGAVIIQLANSETGIVQDLYRICQIAHQHGAIVVSDATQAIGKIPLNLSQLDIDMITLSSHKIYGPKGAGAFVYKDGNKIQPILYGGSQQRGTRAGTENIPGIVGISTALKLAIAQLAIDSTNIISMRKLLWDSLDDLGDIRWNGANSPILPGHLNVTIRGVHAQDLMLRTPELAFSQGSACDAQTSLPSETLLSMGLSPNEIDSTIRISIGRFNTQEEIFISINRLRDAILNIRAETTGC